MDKNVQFFKEDKKYEDMLLMHHPVSENHPRMPLADRAAQFAPFAALTGYEEEVNETARLTDQRIELDEYEKSVLDQRLQYIRQCLKSEPEIAVTYFEQDERKTGGHYHSVTGVAEKIDDARRCIVMRNKTRIPIEDILELEIC